MHLLIKLAIIFIACLDHGHGYRLGSGLPNGISEGGSTIYGVYENIPAEHVDDITARLTLYHRPNNGVGAILFVKAYGDNPYRPLFGSQIDLRILKELYFDDVREARAAFEAIVQEGSQPWSGVTPYKMPRVPPRSSSIPIRYPPSQATILIVKLAERRDGPVPMVVKNAFVVRMDMLQDITPPAAPVSIPQYEGSTPESQINPQYHDDAFVDQMDMSPDASPPASVSSSQYHGVPDSEGVPLYRNNALILIASYEKATNGHKTCLEGFYDAYQDIAEEELLWRPPDAGIHIIDEIPFAGINQAVEFLSEVRKHGYRGPPGNQGPTTARASVLVIRTRNLQWRGTMRIAGRVVVDVFVKEVVN